jgi:hypothetical protein
MDKTEGRRIVAKQPLVNTKCNGHTKAQIGALVNFVAFKQRLPEMYENRIGQLRDEFDTNLPKEIVDSHLWAVEAKEFLAQHCKIAVHILDRARVKPRHYRPSTELTDLTELVDVMEDRMFDEVLDGVMECVCAKTPDICYQYEKPKREAPLIYEETP